VAYGVILISLSYRYLPVFPQEKELNPLPGAEAETVEEEQQEVEDAAGELTPAAETA
jgi:molybdopterin-containing oxidoreductase family membrane subunit